MYYVHITPKFYKMERRNKRKLDISKNRMCRKWYPLETKDVNKEFLDDIESDRRHQMVIAQMKTLKTKMLKIFILSSWRFFLYERNQFWMNLIIIV